MKKILLIAVCVTLVFTLGACKDKEKNNYGDTKGKASGVVEMTDSGLKVDIKDILAEVGDNVDYTSDIVFKNVSDDAYVQVYADTSAVDMTEPGTYDVEYTINYDDLTVNRTAHVTVEDSSSGDDSSGSSTSSSKKTSSSASSQTDEELSTEVEEKDIGSANIELLSGNVATVKQTNLRFIEETYTENTNVERGGKSYLVSKLIVKFNTGELQVLETIEHPLQ